MTVGRPRRRVIAVVVVFIPLLNFAAFVLGLVGSIAYAVKPYYVLSGGTNPRLHGAYPA